MTDLKLSEVRDRIGINVDTLKMLIDDKFLPGVIRKGRGGHARIRADMVPSREDVIELLQAQRRLHLERARAAVERVEVEVEAVKNDIAMALEEPDAELGHDLLTLKTYSNTYRDNALISALHRMEEATWSVRLYDEALREAERLRPEQV